ncbi:MAG: N-acetylmuramoyl-L-alanine amidase [Planctomycetes bacterium]|nr:N-acetylmuramoyl-L-alanine amidase [Planctomycetota bacterium]
MRKTLFVALASIILFTGQFTPAVENITYIAITQLAEKYNLRHEKDTLTGREIFSGNGYSIIAAPGMSSILINEKLTVLNDRLGTVNGELAISERDVPKVETVLLQPHQEDETTTKDKTRHGLKKIVIDPGHGGDFRGAKGKNGLLEKDINLDVAKRLKKLLEQEDIKVIMTRERDVSLSANLNEDLQRRADIANREHPDLFISIHSNWSADSSVQGFEIYYCPDKNGSTPAVTADKIGTPEPIDKDARKMLSYLLKDEYETQTMELAREIKKSFRKLPTDDRGIRKANFRVIKQSECPALLVEMDFISNKKVSRHMADESYRQEIAERLSKAILSYGTEVGQTDRFTK